MTAQTRLLADVGGTHCRFAWQAHAGAELTDVLKLKCADFPSLGDAIDAWLERSGRGAPANAAIAIANPVTGDRVRMTNRDWSFSIAELKARFGFERLRVLNDFTALALALPGLADADKRQVGGVSAVGNAAIGLIGPGTGLGVSGLIPDGQGQWTALEGEGGHVTLGGRTPREREVLVHIEKWFGHASAERAVSGPGLVEIRNALHAIDRPGQPTAALSAAQIVEAAAAQSDCREAVDLFCAFLGTVAGDLALTLGARGGVYIGGGVVPHLGDAFDSSRFRERFETKGRFAAYLAAIPVYVIVARTSPALDGAARALDGPGRAA